ncbi:MAG: hypothetical protein ACYS0G_16180 [Planctomycetota bacterium]|jgi:hypothetical protein
MWQEQQRAPRRRRRILVWTGALVIALVLVIALAPTFVNWGLGRGAVHGAFEKHINGTVEVSRLDLGWFGDCSAC